MEGKYKWVITGTPIQNKLEDLFPLLKIIDMKPYCEINEFNQRVLKKYQMGDVIIVKKILSSVLLRRSKEEYLEGLGEIEERVEMVELSKTEQTVYD